jgi:hypothetical protein
MQGRSGGDAKRREPRKEEEETETSDDKSVVENSAEEAFAFMPVVTAPVILIASNKGEGNGTKDTQGRNKHKGNEPKSQKQHINDTLGHSTERIKHCERHYVIGATPMDVSVSRGGASRRSDQASIEAERFILIKEEWERYVGSHLYDASYVMCHFLCYHPPQRPSPKLGERRIGSFESSSSLIGDSLGKNILELADAASSGSVPLRSGPT